MSLSGLPTELVLHIFNNLDHISSAAALSQTSRHVHEIWRYNLDSILDAVLPRVIEYYDQVHQVLETTVEPTIIADQASVEDKFTAAISRAKTLFKTADTGYQDLKSYELELEKLARVDE